MPHSEKTRQLPFCCSHFPSPSPWRFSYALFVFELVRVEGPQHAAYPLEEDDEFICGKGFKKHFGDPARYDVVICHMGTTAIPTM